MNERSLLPEVLFCLGYTYRALGERRQAVEFWAAAQQSPYIANSRWSTDVVGREMADVVAGLPAEAVAAARGRVRDLLVTANEVMGELGRE